MELIPDHQFGHTENLFVRGGQPDFDCGLKVVRVAKWGGENECCEGHQQRGVRNGNDRFPIFVEALMRLENGTAVRLEFRHRSPLLPLSGRLGVLIFSFQAIGVRVPFLIYGVGKLLFPLCSDALA